MGFDVVMGNQALQKTITVLLIYDTTPCDNTGILSGNASGNAFCIELQSDPKARIPGDILDMCPSYWIFLRSP